MKKINRSICILLLFQLAITNSFLSQNPIIYKNLENDKWGLIDSVSGKVIAYAKYDLIYPFKYDKAIVVIDRFHGLIDKNGKEIIIPSHNYIRWIDSALIQVSSYIYESIINTNTNEELISFTDKYRWLRYDKGYCVVSNHGIYSNKMKCKLINLSKEVIIPQIYDEIMFNSDNYGNYTIDTNHIEVYKNRKCGLININNDTLIPLIYDIIFIENELVYVYKNKNYGILTKEFKELIPYDKYKELGGFYGGLSKVRKDKLYGYIDLKENLIIHYSYDKAGSFRNGIASVKKGYYWGAIDKKNEVVVPFKYRDELIFFNGISKISIIKNNKYYHGYVNTKGEELTGYIYHEVSLHYKKNYIRVRIDDKWGLIDTLGNVIIPIIYDNIFEVNNIVKVTLNGKEGILNVKNEFIIPLHDQKIISFRNEDYCLIIRNNKYGYVNMKGEIIVPFIYEKATDFINNKASVLLNGKCFLINKNGKRIYL